ncbi:50S ribosomal protein L11 methyltransferase [Halorhodospira halochloris]|uniref:50S ribosomal protein L11 methyltransferase n=1 Tax=Halorhodospira halochloris TaxID=1052 RepID=UPI001EE79D19|nr:50S ribosomal protein L11 methyltransferase [Halorhodospira halochloris]MCG5530590.1 50S ribosomal protein L11 methyltransferase [Halorhodospira halochloris]MCG5547828.1 50S ribosomal protein L11 methyltransferase [Halorhodospira halochloris]
MAQLQVEFELEAPELEYVEALLQARGCCALTYKGDDETPLLEPGVGEHPLWGRIKLSALFDQNQSESEIRRAVEACLGRNLQDWCWEILEDKTWEREWLEHFQPMCFGSRLWIVPSGYEVDIPATGLAIRLDPGLAFGSGTHETTALCLEWLDGEDLTGACGIDYGAGSGVLAVAAAKLGARECLAVDNDPQAVRASIANAKRNGVCAAVPCYEAGREPAYCADFLLANILSSTLISLSDQLLASVRAGGRIALAGILEHQQHQVMEAFGQEVVWDQPRSRGDWVLLSGTRVEAPSST